RRGGRDRRRRRGVHRRLRRRDEGASGGASGRRVLLAHARSNAGGATAGRAAAEVRFGSAAPPVARIPVRSLEDVWTFTQRNVPLWDILEFFPPDAIGPRGPKDPPRP